MSRLIGFVLNQDYVGLLYVRYVPMYVCMYEYLEKSLLMVMIDNNGDDDDDDDDDDEWWWVGSTYSKYQTEDKR